MGCWDNTEGNSTIVIARTDAGDFLNEGSRRKQTVQHSQLSLSPKTNRRAAQKSGEAQGVTETLGNLDTRETAPWDATQPCSFIQRFLRKIALLRFCLKGQKIGTRSQIVQFHTLAPSLPSQCKSGICRGKGRDGRISQAEPESSSQRVVSASR